MPKVNLPIAALDDYAIPLMASVPHQPLLVPLQTGMAEPVGGGFNSKMLISQVMKIIVIAWHYLP